MSARDPILVTDADCRLQELADCPEQRGTDLLAQVADSREEATEVRRILGQALNDPGMRNLNAPPLVTGQVREADLDAQRAWKRAPWPTTAHNHAHRYSRCASGPCAGGRNPCATPEACQAPAPEPGRQAPRAGDFWRVVLLVLASWAAVAATLIATGITP